MITGLLLVAGRTPRTGAPKLLHRLTDGVPLAVHSARSLRNAVDRAVAIVRPNDTAVAALLRQHGFEVFSCPDSEGGEEASLAFGVRVTGGSTAWLVGLADMPSIKPSTAQAVADKLRSGALMVAPSFDGRHGHPVGFGRALGPQLGTLARGEGVLTFIKTHRHLLTTIACDNTMPLGHVSRASDIRRGPKVAIPNQSPENPYVSDVR